MSFWNVMESVTAGMKEIAERLHGKSAEEKDKTHEKNSVVDDDQKDSPVCIENAEESV